MQLDGKRVVMTGAAGGIGSLLAAKLKAAGARVTGVDRGDCGTCDESIVADLSTRDGLDALASRLAGYHVDILVNLAGVQYFGPFERQSNDSIWTGYVVNLVAPAVLSRSVIPQMLERGAGQIVNVGSVLGAVNYPHFATYSSSKCGLRGFSEALRRELGTGSIVVTHIAPRAVRTAFNDDTVNRFLQVAKMRADDPDRVAARMASAIAARRKDVTIGLAEQFFSRLNGAFPRVVDVGLAGTTRKAKTLFAD